LGTTFFRLTCFIDGLTTPYRSLATKLIGAKRNLRRNSGPANLDSLRLLTSKAWVTAMSLNAGSISAFFFSDVVIMKLQTAPRMPSLQRGARQNYVYKEGHNQAY